MMNFKESHLAGIKPCADTARQKTKIQKVKKKPEIKRDGFKYETRSSSREEHLRTQIGDIDPAKYAGESWFATEEYARPEDILNPYTRGEVGKENDYYPGPKARKKKR